MRSRARRRQSVRHRQHRFSSLHARVQKGHARLPWTRLPSLAALAALLAFGRVVGVRFTLRSVPFATWVGPPPVAARHCPSHHFRGFLAFWKAALASSINITLPGRVPRLCAVLHVTSSRVPTSDGSWGCTRGLVAPTLRPGVARYNGRPLEPFEEQSR